jgi:hypothetical protein
LNPGKFVEECRRYAHTLQKGKDREEAIDEFIERVDRLYETFGEPLPPPTPPQAVADEGSFVSDGEAEEDEEAYAEVGSQVLKAGESLQGIAVSAQSEAASEGSSVSASGTAYSSATVSGESGLAAWHPKNMLSKEWWTPTRGVIVAAGTGAALSLIAGGIYLANKFVRRKQKSKEQRARRTHARSWNIVDVNTGEVPVRIPM